MLKPEIKVTLFPRKDKNTSEPVEEPTVDYIAAAEEAAARLGKKILVGAVAFSVITVAAVTLGNIAVAAAVNAIEK